MSNDKQLISPSPYRPWIVEVVSAVPKDLADDLDRYITGATCPGWACLGLPNGQLFVWQHQSSHLGSPADAFQVTAPKHMIRLYHPAFFTTKKNGTPPLLVELAPADRDALFVYVAHPVTGVVVVWKVTQNDMQNAMGELLAQPKYAHTYLDLERDDDGEDDRGNSNSPNKRPRRSSSSDMTTSDESVDEILTSLTVVSRSMVVLGTSSGSIFCCTQTTIPVSLHAQRAVPVVPKSGGLFSSLFGSGTRDQGGPISDGSPIVAHLPWTSRQDADDDAVGFVSISEQGNVVHWTMVPTVASTHKVTVRANHLGSLLDKVQQERVTEEVEVLQAAMSGQHLHVLLRTNHRLDDNTTDCRLYWVRLCLSANDEEEDSNGDASSPPSMEWLNAQWLNRFPAPQEVQVMGLILTDNGMAYAAFHQRSGGVTSSVIVMALSDPSLTNAEDDDEMGDYMSNNNGNDDNAIIIYEVDLPMTEIPSLLPATIQKDVVTHGICVLSGSGLGIRIRVAPPSAVENPTSPRAGASSPRKKRAANPALVLTLATHLRGAFWESYEHPAVSLKLPPSLLQASPGDLEEAAVAVATQLQEQGGDVYNTSNVLEWHLAFMELLRQGGLYRKLSTCARWRLLQIGQEIAAFLALGMPLAGSSPRKNENAWEEEQLSQLLASHGIAQWLQTKLDEVLAEGMGDPSNFHSWCGFFSTALATAMTYREERASVPYDILPQHPPLVSGPVPVWTSHGCLQDIFRRLFEFWRINPKSTDSLPHAKTIEVVVQAALQSFADSAHSLATDDAIALYDEIKAVAIPLLRRISRGKEDPLAFRLSIQHEYYEGICQLAHDHESKKDRDAFRFEPLFASNKHCVGADHATGLAFAPFVITWHTDRGLFGHAIMYGRHSPQELNHMLQADKRLHPYQWIQAVHRGDYEGASKSLLSDADKEAALSSTRWALCLAKLSNQVLVKESKSQESVARDRQIDQKLELAAAQGMLFEDEAPEAASRALSAPLLLKRAMERVDQAAKSGLKEDAIRFCNIGLAICATFDDPSQYQPQAHQVWLKCIGVDKELFDNWLRNEDDLVSSAISAKILEETVFGGLLEECARESGLAKVTFGSASALQKDVLEHFPASMRRVLLSTTKFHETGGGAYRETDAIMMN